LLAAPDLVVVPAVRQNLPYDVEKLTYLTRVWVQTTLIVTGSKSGINSIHDLVQKIKSNPGQIRHATYGVGSINHLGQLSFDFAIGGSTIAVPYGGQGPASIDTVSGQLEFLNGAAAPLLDGLKPLAATGNMRHPLFPDLPRLSEIGYKDAEWLSWFGFLAPANLPQPIADRLTREINAVMKEPEVIEKLRKATSFTQTEEPLTGEAFRKFALDDLKRWKQIAARAKVSVQ
jgi:tripartite-type tricarboxylate transporter receptor subunit TctC